MVDEPHVCFKGSRAMCAVGQFTVPARAVRERDCHFTSSSLGATRKDRACAVLARRVDGPAGAHNAGELQAIGIDIDGDDLAGAALAQHCTVSRPTN